MAGAARTEAPFVPLGDVKLDTLTKIYFSGLKHDRPDAMMYEAGGKWLTLSHREVSSQVERAAAGLASLGIGRGDRVGLLSENRPEWAISDFAALGLGAIDVSIYATLPSRHVQHILEDSGAKLIFVSNAEQYAKIVEIRAQLPALQSVVVFDSAAAGEGVITFKDLLNLGERHTAEGKFPGIEETSASIGRDDVATLIYTSGTTGDPKGVMLTHFNIASNVAATNQHEIFDVEPGFIALSFLPLSHSFERMVDYYCWWSGVSLAYVSSVDKVAESMLAVRPHLVAAAPRIFEKIYGKVMGATGVKRALVMWAKKVGEAAVEARLHGKQTGPVGVRERLADKLVFSKLRARTGGRIQAFASGSAPLSADIAKFFWAAGLPLYEGYGLTETSPVLTVNKPGKVRLGSVGLPLPGTELKLGPEGEILARGPQVMKGYFGKPEATAETLDADGWFHTGDVGVIDADGFLTITDRIKNLIVTAGGKNVAPAPIENAVAMSPYISQVVMIGDRKPFTALLVVPDYDNLKVWAKEQGIASAELSGLAANARVHEFLEKEALSRLTGFARYEVPKKVAIVADEFSVESGEITPTLKVKRKVVEANYKQLIEQIYAAGTAD